MPYARTIVSKAMLTAIMAAVLVAGSPAMEPSSVAAAEAVDAATRAALQDVISKQLQAFRDNDGKAAEAFAAPGIQKAFPTPEAFFAMVREHYAALIDPKSTTFTEIVPSPHGPLQKMTVVAKDGSVWTAVYSFEQVDGAWRITGCGMERDSSQQDI